jgi:hypothetical protein
MSNYENLFGQNGFYSGREGCLRLAREYGYALNDYNDEKQVKNDISSSYSALCVRVYRLNPPVSAKEWVEEVKKGRRKNT